MIRPIKLGLAVGVLAAVWMFLLTVLNMYTGYGMQLVGMLKDLYPGYEISWMGSLIGTIYGFIDWFLASSIIGWLYNKFE